MASLIRDKFLSEINAKWKNKNCPMCSHNNWNVDGNMVAPMRLSEKGGIELGGQKYLPFAFLPLLCPLTAVFCAITGIGVYDTEGKSLRGKTMKRVAE